MATVGPLPDETQNTSTRLTVDGRKLTYKLNVIQCPERARACGQGAKSTSDRRPVDPPPIVDLVVLEGDEQRDITFTHNANFILFVSLEKARPIAHGRIPQGSDNPPVLTGSAVAGMAYLERPSPAGYFVFSDLSVRHEGQYRLEFHLWEHVKDPKDASPDDTDGYNNVGIDGEFYKRRCHVKSSPFSVFSAKKFPGLTESTVLSRTVADQGCRVRIRRDVRMRRRTDKSATKDWESYEDDTAAQRQQRSASPEGMPQASLPAANHSSERPGSSDSTANTASYQQHQQSSRRTSAQTLPAHYTPGFVPQQDVAAMQAEQPQLAAPHGPALQPGYATQLNYPQSHMAAYPGAYAQPYMGQPQMVQAPMHAYQAPQQYAYSQAPSPAPQTQAGQTVPPNMAYGFVPQPMYDTQVAPIRQDGMEYMNGGQPGYQRPSMLYGQATSPMDSSDGSSMANGASLPPLQRMDMVKVKTDTERSVPPPSDYAGMSARPAKRSFGSTFNMQHINEPLRHGARPDVVAGAMQEGSDGSDEDLDWAALKMTYRRADGSQTVRQWPPA